MSLNYTAPTHSPYFATVIYAVAVVINDQVEFGQAHHAGPHPPKPHQCSFGATSTLTAQESKNGGN